MPCPSAKSATTMNGTWCIGVRTSRGDSVLSLLRSSALFQPMRTQAAPSLGVTPRSTPNRLRQDRKADALRKGLSSGMKKDQIVPPMLPYTSEEEADLVAKLGALTEPALTQYVES